VLLSGGAWVIGYAAAESGSGRAVRRHFYLAQGLPLVGHVAHALRAAHLRAVLQLWRRRLPLPLLLLLTPPLRGPPHQLLVQGGAPLLLLLLPHHILASLPQSPTPGRLLSCYEPKKQ
jgi:hypothetical protein